MSPEPDWGVDVVTRIFGTEEPSATRAHLENFCDAHLGVRVDELLFHRVGMSSVHGLRLLDGRTVVVKAHQPERHRVFLSACYAVQRRLAGIGFPVPMPLTDIHALGDGLAAVEQLVIPERTDDREDPRLGEAMAKALAQVVSLCTDQPHDHLPRAAIRRVGGTWVPHSSLFDFDRTREGAEWIEAAGDAAASITSAVDLPSAMCRLDWRLGNVEVLDGQVCVAYDWDSIVIAPEAWAAGRAAATYIARWNEGDSGRKVTTIAEASAFLDHYASERGQPWAHDERRMAAAAATDHIAYGARCEHAAGWPETQRSLRCALRGRVDEWLDL